MLYYITLHHIAYYSVLDFYVMQFYWSSPKANGTTRIHFSTILLWREALFGATLDKKRFDGAWSREFFQLINGLGLRPYRVPNNFRLFQEEDSAEQEL